MRTCSLRTALRVSLCFSCAGIADFRCCKGGLCGTMPRTSSSLQLSEAETLQTVQGRLSRTGSPFPGCFLGVPYHEGSAVGVELWPLHLLEQILQTSAADNRLMPNLLHFFARPGRLPGVLVYVQYSCPGEGLNSCANLILIAHIQKQEHEYSHYEYVHD